MVGPSTLGVTVDTYPFPNENDTVFVDPQLPLRGGALLTHSGCGDCSVPVTSGSGNKDSLTFQIDLKAANVRRFSDNVSFSVHACLARTTGTPSCGDAAAKILLPIVLVHGIFEGSSIWDSLSSYMGTADGVDPAVGQEQFAGSGYSESGSYPTVFRFGYDSLTEANEKSAGELWSAIQNDLSRTYAIRVTIVAHSMGGNISRYYINQLGGAPKVSQLVMLGTPLEGATQAGFYKVTFTICQGLLGGGCANLIGAFCSVAFNADTCTTLATEIAKTGQPPAALNELLPTYDWYRGCPQSERCTPFRIQWKNSFLEKLNAAPPARGPLYCNLYGNIASSGTTTHLGSQDTVVTVSASPSFVFEYGLGAGDHWVPVRSSRAADTPLLGGAIHTRDVGQVKHGNLMSTPSVMGLVAALALGTTSC
jgi:pimeloyl-ACP methyl ester carboxylesterase